MRARRRFIRTPGVPLAPAHRPIRDWLPANRGFYANFRTWLHLGGYSASALNLYGVAARLAFGLLEQPYWRIDPDADLDRVRDYIRAEYASAATRQTYFKGLAKLAEYLRRRCHRPAPPREVRWEHFVGPLPDELADAVRAYVTHCRRAWPADRQLEAAGDLLSHLTLSLRWLAAHAGLAQPAELTPGLWFAYVDARLAAGIRPTTLNGELACLQGWLRFLAGGGRPVCARMLRVEPLDEGDRLPRDVPAEQLRALLAAVQAAATARHAGVRRTGLLDRAWLLLMLHSGLRTGEVRRLRPGDLDWAARRVRIEQSKGLQDRLVPLSPATLEALRAYLAVRGPSEALPDAVFVYRHAPLSGSYCYERLRTYGRACGFRVTPHQLRHSCATLLLNAGAPVLTVQAILGHQHVDTTLGYARLYDGTLAADYYRAMAQVEERLRPPGAPPAAPPGHGELLALVDSLRSGTLNAAQVEAVRALRAGIAALAEREAQATGAGGG